jgi:chaperone BCS1
MKSSRYILNGMLMSNINTNNQIIDYILNFVVLTLITYIFQNISYIHENIYNIIDYLQKKNYVEIIIESSFVTYDRNGIKTSKMQYSDAFKSICFYIKNLKTDGIYSKREPDKCEKTSNPTFDIFIPDQYKEFVLEKSKDIRCIMKIYKQKLNTENDTISRCSFEKKEHYMRIFSNNKSTKIEDLEQFIKGCISSYTTFKDLNILNEQHYFNYNCLSEDNELEFTENIFKTNKTFDTIFFEEKHKFLEKLNFFLENKDWYNRKGIPYHFGVFLHGEPGCGKTSIIKATAKLTGKHIFNIHLNRVKTCGELYNIFFNQIVNDKKIPLEKRIYVFEDIDCLTDIIEDREQKEVRNKNENILLHEILLNEKSKPTKPDDSLNLGALLNIFDGLLESPGRIIFMTTNFPQKIDKALLRPGRIDVNIKLKKCSNEIIIDILSYFFEIKREEILILLNNNSFQDYVLTPSAVFNLCINNNTIEDCILEIKRKDI